MVIDAVTNSSLPRYDDLSVWLAYGQVQARPEKGCGGRDRTEPSGGTGRRGKGLGKRATRNVSLFTDGMVSTSQEGFQRRSQP